MRKLVGVVVAGAVLTGGVFLHWAAPRYAASYESSCWASFLVDAGEVHTESWDRPEYLGDDLNGYTAVHWVVRRPTAFLPSHPEPGHCEYQLALTLRPDHARRLTTQITAFSPAVHQISEAPVIWPTLSRFVPADARWTNNPDYDREHGPRLRRLYVDGDNAIAFVAFVLD